MISVPLNKYVNTAAFHEELVSVFPTWYDSQIPKGEYPYKFRIETVTGTEEFSQTLFVPDDADLEMVNLVINAHDQETKTAKERTKETVMSLYQSSIGIRVQDLTSAQIKAVLVVLLYKNGMIDSNLRIVPLIEL